MIQLLNSDILHRRVYCATCSVSELKAGTPTAALRQWHRVKLLGGRLDSLSINGEMVSEKSLDMLNAWVFGGGAWNCSAMKPADGAAVIDEVLGGYVFPIVTGPAGAGRCSSRASLDEFLKKRSSNDQREFW